MSKISIDIGHSFAHLAVARDNVITPLEDIRMSCAVSKDGTIMIGESVDRYADQTSDSVEYVRYLLEEANAHEYLNGCSYIDIFAALFKKIKENVVQSYSPITEVYILTSESFSPLDEKCSIIFSAAKKVFDNAKIDYFTTAEAAAKQYRYVTHHTQSEKILVFDIGTRQSTCSIVTYNNANERESIYCEESCVGAHFIEELLAADDSNYNCWNENVDPTLWKRAQQTKIDADLMPETVKIKLNQHYILYVDMLLKMCKHMISNINLKNEDIDTLLLIGGNSKSTILRKSLKNRLVVMGGNIMTYDAGWNYSQCAVLGILLSDKSSIASIYVQGKKYALTVGDNIFGSSSFCHHIISGPTMCPQHFKITVTPCGNNYIYTIYIIEGQVYVGYVLLGKDSWLPKSFLLDNTKEWTAGGLKFELKED